jgi:3-methyl-2-oxobutanoate hydroxymethyltransferase
VTLALAVPTIGIGAGPGCDGQVLVLQDMLGFHPEFRPRFSRRFAEGAALMRDGARAFTEAVKNGGFPSEEEGF